jgi:hypothetical protein
MAADRRDPVAPADAMVSLGFRRSGCTITGGLELGGAFDGRERAMRGPMVDQRPSTVR